ncbi:MAG: radical SAM domain-containing [Geobacteraceae bacterium]|nr:MAG: radical SAM domain-containing [Geobacteraceae bacterium]
MHVVLAAIHSYPSPQAVPLANAFLKAYLATDEGLSDKVSVALCDLFVSQPTKECVSAILAEKPDAVGFSMYLWNRGKCLEIAAALRREKPELTVFAGGPEPTADPEGVLDGSALDFIITGEGEIPFVESVGRLCAGKTAAGIKGVSLFEAGRFVGSPPIPVQLLDTLPSPYLSGSLDPGRYSGVLWQLSRGCDFGCDFCFDNKGGKGVRRFSLERIGEELRYLAKRGVTQVFVLDSTFNQDVKRAKEILRLIKRIAPHIHFHFEVRSEFIDMEMARLFAQVNCSLQIGLQSADPQIQKGVGRIFNPAEFSNKVALLNETGAVFGFDLIYGLPGDTPGRFAESLDYAVGLYPNHLDIFPLAVLPGTRLADRAGFFGLRHRQKPPYTLQSSPTFPAREMESAAELAAACDIFYSRGKAVAWFNAVIAPLKLSPSAFFHEFRLWLKAGLGKAVTEADLSDHEVWQAQHDFTRHIFAAKRLKKLLPAALDLIDYHFYYAAALLATPPELPADSILERTDLLAQPFLLARSARLARFNYEIFDILEAGDLNLREFAECFTPTGSFAVIYPRSGEVFTESLIETYFTLLERLDGKTTANHVIAALRIPPEEARSFMEFAAAEGIVTLPGIQRGNDVTSHPSSPRSLP